MGRAYILSTFHPAVLLVYFIAVIALSICIDVPEFIALSLCFGAITYILLSDYKALKMLLGLLAFSCIMSLISPFFNPLGQTVIFTYFGGRPYTLEAIAYGASVACIFSSMIVWFCVLSKVIDAEKMSYLFGGVFPTVGLIITSSLALFTRFLRRLKDLNRINNLSGQMDSSLDDQVDSSLDLRDASACDVHGKPKSASLTKRIMSAGSRVTNLIHWSFDEGVDRANTMRSRGFGTGKRSTYEKYSFRFKDAILLLIVFVSVAMVVVSVVVSGVDVVYFPSLYHLAFNPYFILGVISFFVLLLIPTMIVFWGWLRWRSCMLRI